jgi:nucleoside transporter
MDPSLRLRLSTMMFLQYFVWGVWAVSFSTFMSRPPTVGGLGFPGGDVGWIYATLPIGAMISPIFIGLFADRLFATEKVLAALHIVGAVLLGWAAFTCSDHQPRIKKAFEEAVSQVRVGSGSLHDALKQEEAMAEALEKSAAPNKQDLAQELARFRTEKTQPALEVVTESNDVKKAVANAFWPLFWIMVGYALCYMPTITLTNSLSFRNLSDPDRYFGGIRVLGTIGWIVAGLLFLLFDIALALNIAVSPIPLYLAAGASLVLGMFCFFLPHTPPSGKSATIGESIGLPALAMLKDPPFLVFFVCSFLITIVLAFYYTFANPFLTDIQAPSPVALQTIGQVSEIFFMLMIPLGLRLFGTKGMLIVGMLAWCLRYAIFATQNLYGVIAIGLPLHGICYDFFFVVSYLYVDRKAPPDLRASAQAIITFITLGVGMFIGNLLAGQVNKWYTVGGATAWSMVWIVPLAGSVFATVLFWLLFRDPTLQRVPEAAAQPST